MARKTLFASLVMLLFISSAFTAYAQTTLSGRYVADEDDAILFLSFEFTGRNTVRMVGIQIMGYGLRATARYEIEDGYVIIEYDGDIMELEIIDANTLEDEYGVRYIKRSSSQR